MVYAKYTSQQKVRPSAALGVTTIVGRIRCKFPLKPDVVEEVCDHHISWDRTFTGDSPAHVRGVLQVPGRPGAGQRPEQGWGLHGETPPQKSYLISPIHLDCSA